MERAALVPESDLPPLSPRLADLADLACSQRLRERTPDDDPWEFPSPDELTEVIGLRAAGWCPLDAGPELELLPPLRPAEHRGWLPDRLPSLGTRP